MQLLEKMRDSRAALAHQLDQIPARNVLGTQVVQKAPASKVLGVAIVAAFVAAALVTRRRQH